MNEKEIINGLEKISSLSSLDMLSAGAAALTGSMYGKNVAGDVANKLAPFGTKTKAEKSARRYGTVIGGASTLLSALYLLKRKGKLRNALLKRIDMDPEAADVAVTAGIPVASIAAGWLSGYPTGSVVAGVNSMNKKINP